MIVLVSLLASLLLYWLPVQAGVLCDGTDDVVTLSNESLLDCTDTTCSFSFWLRSSSTTNDRQVIQKEDAGGFVGWEIYLYAPSGTNLPLRVKVRDTGGNAATQWNGTVTLNNNVWHHVVILMTTDTNMTGGNSNDVTVYIDGVRDVGSQTHTGVAYAPTKQAVLWCRDVTHSTYWSGRLEDVRVFSGALSVAEIGALYGSRQRQRVIPRAEQVSFPLDRCADTASLNGVVFRDVSQGSTATPSATALTCDTTTARLLPKGGLW